MTSSSGPVIGAVFEAAETFKFGYFDGAAIRGQLLPMPSIEILVVGQTRPAPLGDLPFAVEADDTRRSHRLPSRFQSDFNRLPGILYHLGNPSLKSDREGRIFFAYELLSRESQGDAQFLEFAPEYRPHVRAMLDLLLSESPAHQIVFTSDWQFGPDWTRRETVSSFESLWNLHDSRQLLLNALYSVCREISP